MERKKLKVLNGYAGLGGNRKDWPDDEIEVTAIENDSSIAEIYQNHFPDDIVIVTDCHEYILEHYQEYDFIWLSTPCPTHSKFKEWRIKCGDQKPVYPDMALWQEIIFLKHFFKGKWVVENVKSYYEPLIRPQEVQRHYFWANFIIPNERVECDNIQFGKIADWQRTTGFNLDGYKGINKKKVLRNCVHPKLGLHIYRSAFKEPQQTLTS